MRRAGRDEVGTLALAVLVSDLAWRRRSSTSLSSRFLSAVTAQSREQTGSRISFGAPRLPSSL